VLGFLIFKHIVISDLIFFSTHLIIFLFDHQLFLLSFLFVPEAIHQPSQLSLS